MLIALLLLIIVLMLLMSIPVVREFAGAFLLAIGILWIIRENGGDSEAWAPYVVGFMIAVAALRWIAHLFPARVDRAHVEIRKREDARTVDSRPSQGNTAGSTKLKAADWAILAAVFFVLVAIFAIAMMV